MRDSPTTEARELVLAEMCETESRCRALLAAYDKSSPDGVVPLDEVIAAALSTPQPTMQQAIAEVERFKRHCESAALNGSYLSGYRNKMAHYAEALSEAITRLQSLCASLAKESK